MPAGFFFLMLMDLRVDQLCSLLMRETEWQARLVARIKDIFLFRIMGSDLRN